MSHTPELAAPQNSRVYAKNYAQEGFVVGPRVLEADLIRNVHHAMDAVMAGEYETGVRPIDTYWNQGDDPNKKIRKIDQPHLSNHTIHEVISHPGLGRWVAAITGAQLVQVWAVQLLHKPSSSDTDGAVGWHQDYQYWSKWWTPESNVFTAWLAISHVDELCGPACFVPGSHHWGFLNEGDFFGTAGNDQRQQIHIPKEQTWREVAATMPAGSFSLHHRLTYHGSHPNVSGAPRRSFAIHLRTQDATATPECRANPTDQTNYDFVSYLEDHHVCPVIYKA